MACVSADVVVIGAGVAGLTAARELAAAGLHTIVLEAKAHAGGRIHTVRPPGWPGPVELGAEFIHGGNEALWETIRGAGLATRPVQEKHWYFRAGALEPADDVWTRIDRVLEKIGPDAARTGESFADFLDRAGSEISAEDRMLARTYVEGFNAAPATRMSAAAMYEESQAPDQEQFRPADGYQTLIATLEHASRASGLVRFIFETIVTRVSWRQGVVEINTRVKGEHLDSTVQARAAIVTLPLGVLKQHDPALGAVTFEPHLVERDALLARLEVGSALHLALRFVDSFWAEPVLPEKLRADSGLGFGFLHSDMAGFPVWWSAAPRPILIAWAGGPAAETLRELPPEARVGHALDSLARLTQTTPDRLRAKLLDWRLHDWHADPFARGAYAYATVGAEDAPARLRSPAADTLFFAGEATADSGELGTVHGAFASGIRAAREAIERLRPAESIRVEG